MSSLSVQAVVASALKAILTQKPSDNDMVVSRVSTSHIVLTLVPSYISAMTSLVSLILNIISNCYQLGSQMRRTHEAPVPLVGEC